MKLYMEYKRPHVLIQGVYTYVGKIQCPDGEVQSFIGTDFKGLVKLLHRLLNKYEGIDEVLMQRTDSPGIPPMGLGPAMIELLKTDPLSAYRIMNFDSSSYAHGNRELDQLADVFGQNVYIKMAGGYAECPLTATFRPLAFGSKHGWKIRGEGNSHGAWLPLVKILDSSPDGCVGFERLAFCTWAVVKITDLIATKNTQFYLPRAWNKDGPWISREDLEHMLNNLGDLACQA